jgi:hypothetical protein
MDFFLFQQPASDKVGNESKNGRMMSLYTHFLIQERVEGPWQFASAATKALIAVIVIVVVVTLLFLFLFLLFLFLWRG